MRLRLSTLPLSACAALALAGCTTVGPDYAAPDVPVSPDWLEDTAAGAVEARWWDSFSDPLLSQLVDRALASAPDVRIAQARLAEARALREAAQGGRAPQVNASGSAVQTRISENGQFPVASIPGFEPEMSLFDAGFDASWEIDLWGAQTRQVEGSSAREDAASWGVREAQLALAAEVVRAYTEYRAAQEGARIAQARSDAASAISRLVTLLTDAGEANAIDRAEARGAAATALSALQLAQSDVSASAYRLAALLGQPPEALMPELAGAAAPVPNAPEVIAAGVRSELLLRRPDVRRAERELAASSADIGVATANLYPRFTLTGGLGMQAQNAGDLTDGGSLRYTVGPGFHWPIFSFGRIRAQIRAADARSVAALARYEKAVVTALTESESAANRYAAATYSAQLAAASLDNGQNAFRLSQMRFDAGEDSRIKLEQDRLNLADVQARDLNARAARVLAALTFYKALGGGWEARP